MRAALIVTTAFFGALTIAVVLLGDIPTDGTVREAILGLASPTMLAVMRIINVAGEWRVLAPAMLILFLVVERARRQWWLWLAVMLAAPLTEGTLKVIVARPRPEQLSYGFPSGHATAAAAFFGTVIYLSGSLPSRACRIVRVAALVVIVLVGVARVMLRAHWPSDVAGGMALGLALASAGAVLASVSRPSQGAARTSEG